MHLLYSNKILKTSYLSIFLSYHLSAILTAIISNTSPITTKIAKLSAVSDENNFLPLIPK